MRMRVSQSSVLSEVMRPSLRMSFCSTSVHSTSKGRLWKVRESWSTLKTVSESCFEVAPGSSGMLPPTANMAVRNRPKKMVSSATWTAYAPRRFHTFRSPKTKVLPPFSVTTGRIRDERKASETRSTATAREGACTATLALCSCPRSQCAEASSFLREM
jgi:hypothetical protein